MKTVSVPNWFFEHPDYYGDKRNVRNVWADYVPSDRQLKKLGISLKEVGNGELCWSHMESEFSYQLEEECEDLTEEDEDEG